MDLLQWYAQQVCEYQKNTSVQVVDYLDIHYYPQGASSSISPALTSFDDPTNRQFRYRSLRSLYDPTFTDESWIGTTGKPVLQFIPYLRNVTSNFCPLMKIAITEWNWGNDDIISGAVASAEAMAIFGREGVDLATRWVVPSVGSLGEQAFRLYLDYDGLGSVVNGNSVMATTDDLDMIGSYAIYNSTTGQVFVYLFNHFVYNNQSTAVTVTVSGAADGVVTIYGFDTFHSYGQMGTTNIAGGVFTVDTLYSSATLAVVNMAGGGSPTSGSQNTATTSSNGSSSSGSQNTGTTSSPTSGSQNTGTTSGSVSGTSSNGSSGTTSNRSESSASKIVASLFCVMLMIICIL